MTRDWEPDSTAPVALRCDVTTLCQRLPSRLIIWLAALTKMVDRRAQSVTNPYEPAIFHPLVWSTSLWMPPADFHNVIITDWTLLRLCDKSLCLFVTAKIKLHHISFCCISLCCNIYLKLFWSFDDDHLYLLLDNQVLRPFSFNATTT